MQYNGMTEGFGHTLGPWGRFPKTSFGGRNTPLIPQINMRYGQVMLRHCTCEPSRSHIRLLPGTRWRCGSKVGKPDPSSLPVWALTTGQWLTFFAIWESSLAAWQVDPDWNSGCCLMIFDWISQNFLVHIAQVAGTLWALWYRNCEAGRTCGFQAPTFSASQWDTWQWNCGWCVSKLGILLSSTFWCLAFAPK